MPVLAAAARIEPSLDDAIRCQLTFGAEVSVHVPPESFEVYIPLPPRAIAASLEPSPDDAIETQFRFIADVCVHVCPQSSEV